jgi:BirA family biotin operon repressor/biotin-[acetyl-CoA-carboxylase] ligase
MSVIFLNPIIKLDVVDSTNNYATARLVREGWDEGTVVVANEQLQGRGQINNSWESEKGKNLLFSIVLYPNFISIQNQFLISKIIALAVSDILFGLVENVSIKWPNDIYVGEKKIAGILIENAIMGSDICWVVAGVGLNINQAEFRSEAPNPISLSSLTGSAHDLDEILIVLLHNVDRWYKILKDNGIDEVDREYLCRLYRLNEVAKYSDSKGLFSGKIIGVNQYGHLLIQKSEGDICSYSFKEVAFL